MPYVYSTLSCDQAYTNYQAGGGDLPVVKSKVLVKGGTNIANDRLVTPMGVVTKISDDELAELNDNYVFLQHVKNGFITIGKSETNPEKVAANMANRDKSAPMVPADFDLDDDTKAKPVLGAKKKKAA